MTDTIAIDRKELAGALRIMAPIAPKKFYIVTQSSVSITQANRKLRLTVNNADMMIEKTLDVESDQIHSTVLLVRALARAVAVFPDGPVEIGLEDYTKTMNTSVYRHFVKAGSSTVTMRSYDPSDFPLTPAITPGGPTATVKAEDFIEALRLCSLSAAHEDSRPVLTGISFRGKGGKLELAAADGFRLTVCDIACQMREPFERIVPAEIIKPLIALATGSEKTITIAWSPAGQRFIEFSGGSWRLIASPIEGTFPSYDQLIPKEFNCRAVVNRDAMLQAVKLVKAVGSGITRIKFDKTSGLEISCTGIDDEPSAATKLMPASATGDPGKIAFNVKYLYDVVSSMKGDIVIETTSPSSQAVFRQMTGSTGARNLVHVVMPMFVGW